MTRNTRTGPGGRVERQCTKCGAWKPLDRYYFPVDNRVASGFRATCRECYNAYHRAYQRAWYHRRRRGRRPAKSVAEGHVHNAR